MTSEEIIARQGEIEQRKLEIDAALEQPESDLEALEEEARTLAEENGRITEQLEELKRKAADEAEDRKAVENGAGETKEKKTEDKTMTLEEIRSSAEYVDAYANYIKTGKDEEVRSLLTENASGASSAVSISALRCSISP